MGKTFIISESQVSKILYEQGFKTIVDKVKGVFDNTSCSTKETRKTKSWKQLYDLLVKMEKIEDGEPLIVIWGPNQTLYYTSDGNNVVKVMKVSTGQDGFGNTTGSRVTNEGLMEVSGKIRAPKTYQVLVNKKPIDSVLGSNKLSTRKDDEGKVHQAEVLTGILELTGLEPCNLNVYSRGVYIHGTNIERSLGRKASNGCIRVSNQNILYLLNTIKEDTKVYVKP
jgi:hypothetical protein